MKLKILEIKRGKSQQIIKCENGDLYDSSAVLMDSTGKILYQSEHWNTDATEGYKGGRLAKGTYFGIKGKRKVSYQPEPIDVIKLFSSKNQDLDKIKTDADVPESAWVLPSDIPNPNHEGKPIITAVQCHPGSLKWDWSHGCLTALNYNGYHEFDNLNKLLSDNEIIVITLL